MKMAANLTPPKFNIAPEKWWLGFPIGKVTFKGYVKLQGGYWKFLIGFTNIISWFIFLTKIIVLISQKISKGFRCIKLHLSHWIHVEVLMYSLSQAVCLFKHCSTYLFRNLPQPLSSLAQWKKYSPPNFLDTLRNTNISFGYKSIMLKRYEKTSTPLCVGGWGTLQGTKRSHLEKRNIIDSKVPFWEMC